MRKFLTYFAGFFFAVQAGAQPVTYQNFTHYTTENGLGNPNVRKTLEDSKGFIWCATQDGLYRFTGKRFVAYNKTEPGPRRITESVVLDMLEHKGRIWVATAYGGVDAIDITTGQTTGFINEQKIKGARETVFWSLDRQGDTLFVGTNKGLYILNMNTGKLDQNIDLPLKYPKLSGITKIKTDRHNKILWVFARGVGIYALNSETMAVRAFYKEETDYVYDCDLDLRNAVWAGTSGGLRKYTLSGGSIVVSLRPLPSVSGSYETFVYAIRLHGNNIYFSNKQNLVKANLLTGGFSIIKESRSDRDNDWTATVFGITIDRNGFLWLGCVPGLSFSVNRPAAFFSVSRSSGSHEAIGYARSIFPYNDSMVYLSAEEGFYRINTNNGSITAIDKSRSYFFAFSDVKGRIIVSNDENTFVLNGNSLIPVGNVYPEFKDAGPIVINSIVSLSDTMFILGSENKRGIFIWNTRARKLSNIYSKSQPVALEEDVVNTIYKDGSGRVWILSDNAIMLFDPVNHSIRRLSPQNPKEQKNYNLFFDVKELMGQFYINSYGSGVLVLDQSLQFVREITTAQGLANNGVYKLISCRDSILFVTTNNGLSAIHLKDQKVNNYYSADGLHSNEFEELSGASREDVVYAGGKKGFTMVYTRRLTANPNPPVLHWSSVSIETASGTLDSVNTAPELLQIPTNALQTTIFFSGLNFANPSRTTFAYRIKELNRNWIDIQHRDFINLIGLSPGKYTVEVTAFNENGIQTPQPIQLTLHFLPRWYQTFLFQLLLALAVGGLLYAFFRYRFNQIRARQKIRKDIASDLHDDIGATLNSVKVFMHLIKRDPGKAENIEQAEDSLTQAATGLRDMIWVLDDSEDTLQELADRIRKFSIPVTNAQQIAFDTVMDPEINHRLISKTEKRNLLLIAKECVNNSIKYAQCSRITVEIQQQSGKICMTISDNGIGFSVTEIMRGHGLDNISYRAKQIRYRADINSLPGKGTTIVVEER